MAGPPNSVAIASPVPSDYFGTASGPAAAYPSHFQVSGHVQPNIATILPVGPGSVVSPGPTATFGGNPPTVPLPGIGGGFHPGQPHRPGGIVAPPIQLNPGKIPGVPGGPPLSLPGWLRWERIGTAINNLGSGGSPLSYWRRQIESLRFGRVTTEG